MQRVKHTCVYIHIRHAFAGISPEEVPVGIARGRGVEHDQAYKIANANSADMYYNTDLMERTRDCCTRRSSPDVQVGSLIVHKS